MTNPGFFPEIEKKPFSEIREYQNTRLKVLLEYLSINSPFYKELFNKEKIDISKIRTLEDLNVIPVTTKDHLQQNNNDFICVPERKIVDYITTSGTQGDPVTFAMTDRDLDRLAYNEAISFTCADGSPSDIYQLMTTIDRRLWLELHISSA